MRIFENDALRNKGKIESKVGDMEKNLWSVWRPLE